MSVEIESQEAFSAAEAHTGRMAAMSSDMTIDKSFIVLIYNVELKKCWLKAYTETYRHWAKFRQIPFLEHIAGGIFEIDANIV